MRSRISVLALASLTLSALSPMVGAQSSAPLQVVEVRALRPEPGTDRELRQFFLDRLSDDSRRVRFTVSGNVDRDGDVGQSLYVFVDARTATYRTFEQYGPAEDDPRIQDYVRLKSAARPQQVALPRQNGLHSLLDWPRLALESLAERRTPASVNERLQPGLPRPRSAGVFTSRGISSRPSEHAGRNTGLAYRSHETLKSQSGFCWGEASAYLQARDPIGVGLADSSSWANANVQVVGGLITAKLSWGGNYRNPCNPTALGTHWYNGPAYPVLQTGYDQSWGRAYQDAIMWNTDFGSVVTGGVLPDLYTQVEHWTDAYTAVEDGIHYADSVGYRAYGYSALLHFYTYLHAAGACDF